MIALEGLSYSYPHAAEPALHLVDLLVEEGDFAVVAGPTGGGKSTLIRTLNGLVPHFYGGRVSGSVEVFGRDPVAGGPSGMVDATGFVGQDPEDHGVVDRVADDIAFTLENLGLAQPVIRKRVEEVMDALGIADLRDRSLASLSGGERQRVAIAGALASLPKVIVLDEPTSQLDPQSAEEVVAALLRLRDELGVGIVLAEQRLERVLEYADLMVVVREGKVSSGRPREMVATTGLGPPVAQLGLAVGWDPVPLRLKDARLRINGYRTPVRRHREPEGSSRIKLDRVSVRLGQVQVLRGFDLEAREGEVIALMGRNGSGKTTILRAIAGVLQHSGHIETNGTLGLLPQNPARLLHRRSVAEEIAQTLNARGGSEAELAVEAERFGVTGLLGRYPRDLSGGERTRTAMAAALAGDPQILLLDEPTRGMDPAGKTMLAEFIESRRREGATIVIATHDVELAAETATRVIILSRGEIVTQGTVNEVLGTSLVFSTQMSKVFGNSEILTVGDGIWALGAG